MVKSILEKTYAFRYTIPEGKTVPDLYPDEDEFASMPPIFATGFTVGLLELACIKHLDSEKLLNPGEMSLGFGVNIRHTAPCTEGVELEVRAKCIMQARNRFKWEVSATLGELVIATGVHERVCVNRSVFTNEVDRSMSLYGGKTLRDGL